MQHMEIMRANVLLAAKISPPACHLQRLPSLSLDSGQVLLDCDLNMSNEPRPEPEPEHEHKQMTRAVA